MCTPPLSPHASDTEIAPMTETYNDGKVLEERSTRKADARRRKFAYNVCPSMTLVVRPLTTGGARP